MENSGYEYQQVEVIIERNGEIRNITKQVLKNESEKLISYFIHKEGNEYEVRENIRTLEITSFQGNNEMLEINLLMPNTWFVENNNFIYRKDLSKEQIIESEEKDMIYRNYKKIID